MAVGWLEGLGIKPVAIAVLLSLSGIGWTGYQGYSVWQQAAMAGQQSADGQQRAAPVRQQVSYSGQQVAQHDLFGNAAAKPEKAPEIKTEELPETKLKLELKGAIVSDVAKATHAVIVEDKSKKKPKRYYINDSLPGGAILYAVNHHSVVLKRAGRLETLSFKRDRKGIFVSGEADEVPVYDDAYYERETGVPASSSGSRSRNSKDGDKRTSAVERALRESGNEQAQEIQQRLEQMRERRRSAAKQKLNQGR